ncbi:MAG: TonB-dependent hemoglobin/transferrin/lactoferrin family receptor [Acetobacter sp.]|uniref:TonB-dependent hemoglobin/transferrin/lactoferrin family receptor n=1 Tax=Acetobacter sp. TaxID=440 RepID=UPI0039E9072C
MTLTRPSFLLKRFALLTTSLVAVQLECAPSFAQDTGLAPAIPASQARTAQATPGPTTHPATAAPATQHQPITLAPVVVHGVNQTDPSGAALTPLARMEESMRIDPDKDYSNVGKARVFTTTTTLATLQNRMIDNIEDYARRVDAAVNYNTNNFSINMRGLDQNRILTTIDGIRTTWSTNYARGIDGGVSAYDFNSLGGLDIVKNANSSFFGTGALGGVVSMRTLGPEDILKGNKVFGGLSKATYDGASESALLNQALAARYGNTLVLVQGGYDNGSETGNMGKVGGSGTKRSKKDPAHYVTGNFLGKIRHYFEGGHRITLTGEVFDRNYHENTLTSISSTYNQFRTLEESKRSRISGDYDYKAQDPRNLISEAHLTAYWQQVTTITTTMANRLTTPLGQYDRTDQETDTSYGVTGSISSNLNAGPIRNAVTIGGEAYLMDSSEYASGKDNCTPAIRTCAYLHNNQSDMPNVHSTNLGAIVQDRISFRGVDWLHITPGFRFDYYRLTPHTQASFLANDTYINPGSGSHGTHYSPKVLAEVNLLKNLTAYAQYAQAFRAPSANEKYINYGGEGTYLAIGNPQLKPETSRGWEAGLRYGNSRRGAQVSVYDNYYHNFIENETLTAAEAGISGNYPYGIFKYMNRQRVRIYGVEANANWAFNDHWLVWGSIAYTDGRDTQEHVHLNTVVPLRGIVGVGYTDTQWGANFSTTFAAARNKVENMASDTNKTPGYAIFDLTAWYKPSIVKGLRLGVGMYNMFDKTYYNALNIPDSPTLPKAYYSQPGRSFKVTAIINF